MASFLLSKEYQSEAVNQVKPRRNQEPLEQRLNPLSVLGGDLMLYIWSFLEPGTLAQCTCVSLEWRELAADDRLWECHCEELWKGKVQVLQRARDKRVSRFEAYRISLQDGLRDLITEDDLCNNNWTCRFQRDAGDYYISMDPFWKGLQPMRRFFSREGSVTAAPGDMTYGGRKFPWRLIHGTKRSPTEVVVEVGSFPELSQIERRDDWGWRMQNNWVVYSTTGPREDSPASAGQEESNQAGCSSSA